MHFEDTAYTPSPNNLPFSSCQSYAIVDGSNGKLLFQHHAEETREMASLTKIMTAFVTISLSQELRIDMKKTYFYVSKYASRTPGTTA
jgi:D-alanyl-D-alanine carboxypeptidase